MLSLDLPNDQEPFIKAKEAIIPWIKNNASASLLNIAVNMHGLYLEQILKGRTDLWKATLSVGQNIHKVEIRNGIPPLQYIDNLSSFYGQVVPAMVSQEIIQRLEKDGGRE